MTHTQTVEATPVEAAPDCGRPALIFAGQGSQAAGMGRDLAEASADAMNYWKEGERISGLPLREIYWEGDEAAMSDTRALQPALTVANVNLWRALSERLGPSFKPFAAAGHSLGEYSALAAAGVLSPKSVLEITSLRGRLMAEADPEGKGAMAAIVKLDMDAVTDIVEQAAAESGALLVAANRNTPQQTVVSGAREAVALAVQKAKERKGRGVELKVSGAFHSPMMAEANKELAPLLEKATWNTPRFPVYCNVDGKPVHDGESARKSLLRQMVTPVFWVDLIRNLYLAGVRWWMEISPRAVLGKMVGPSMAGIAAQSENLRVDLIDSLTGILNYAM
ncbi:ACP S-malonyltransferase [Desulfovibrio sp.]|uniref:ACP S-malonyltransferase n=1 Tax=Desulfovibrio sp. TaxID=885 RepID=UPI0023D769A4|nr:ACP S-malonyltransferase [Desulfovibrio sp.]MDE7240805.1 ACP S-malonyltransferase [Desulfovibrio sp.]